MSRLPVPLNAWAAQQKIFAEETITDRRASLPVANPTRSFWLKEPNASPSPREGSKGQLPSDADICIIGSGISGISTGYHLAKLLASQAGEDVIDPLRVVILDAREFSSGATGRNGGHLTATAFEGFIDHATLHGKDEALRELAIQRYTVEEVLKVIHEHGQEEHVDLVSSGHIDIYVTENELVAAKADFEAAQAAGADLSHVQWLSKEEVDSQYGANYPGTRYPGHNLWPLKLVSVLYERASKETPKLRLSLHTCTPVLNISAHNHTSHAGRRWSLKTPRGNIACSYVVHATNAYVSHLLPHLQGPTGVVPTRGQVVAVRAAASTEKITKASWSANEGFEYWFPRPVRVPGECPLIILGGAREAVRPHYALYEGDDSVVTAVAGHALRRFLPSVFPNLYEESCKPEMEWTGIMGFTKTGDPFVGPVVDPSHPDTKAYEGQYITAGFSGHGMPRAFACAEAVAGMVFSQIVGKKWVAPSWLPLHYLTAAEDRSQQKS